MSSKDVDMTDAAAPVGEESKEQKEAKVQLDKKKKAIADTVHELRSNLSLLEKGVSTKDGRMISRVLRSTHSLRRRISIPMLQSVIEQCFPPENAEKAALLNYIESITANTDDAMEVDSNAKPVVKVVKQSITPEVEVYLHLLVLLVLAQRDNKTQEFACASALLSRVQSFNRRTMDQFSARAWSHFALLVETQHPNSLAPMRIQLMAAHRTACLRHDEPSQAVLINLILRNFLAFGLYAQADKFRLNAAFPTHCSNYQHARYLYYIGKINAIQLEYSDAFANLTEALRKAPSNGAATGFRQAATKLMVIVQLLTGEIPERSLFNQTHLARSLRPYLQLTQAVRVGDLAAFTQVSNSQSAVFRKDQTATLVARLRHNVIKVALRQINLAYSRIPLSVIAQQLGLDSEDDAACIVAKAIHDNVIEATIDFEQRCVCSNDSSLNMYSTEAPRAAFHARIDFCLQLRNEAVKAMRYPMHMTRQDLETEEERQEREAAEAELLEHLDDDEEDEM